MRAQVVFDLPLSQSFTYRIPEGMTVEAGVRVKASFGRRTLIGYVLDVVEDPPNRIGEEKSTYELKNLSSVLDDSPVFSSLHTDLAGWMARMYFSNLGECLATMIPSGKREREAPGGEEEAYIPKALDLSAEQLAAVEAIVAQPQGMYYLQGMTGSGKTEVFLQAAKRTLEEGRGVVYLVPEIALTAQVVDLIRARFGKVSAVLHSRLTPSQRLAEWRRIVRGEARIVVGARSGVFAPVPRLGLIILDEEHETSYKSQTSPRYHARQIAMRRCSTEGARLVMGSATPSLEAFYLMDQDKLARLTLSRRLAGGALPEVRLISLKGREGALSPELIAEMEETYRLGKQTILFLNRRGFSYFFHCKTCGEGMKCRHCSASLTYHKAQNMMVCHYCGYKIPPVNACTECGSLDVGYSGFGTEHVEEAVRIRFPYWRVERLDGDTAAAKGAMESIIDRFRKGEIDVLLGTQMIAKGLNFPGVRLVGLILADSGLHMPDFRSAERTFGLITQVSGRAGRYTDDGMVLIQTMNPQSAPLVFSAQGKFEEFYRQELQARKNLRFPPYTRIIRVLFRCRHRNLAEERASLVSRELQRFIQATGAGSRLEVLGPAEAPLGLIAGNYRIQLLLLGEDFNLVHQALSRVLVDLAAQPKVYLEIDVDPVSLM
ncbi:MAG: primosomal protein N' [Spirochaetales bacterium]|nr:primosomal protein N' [Spirochaetales bacterium]